MTISPFTLVHRRVAKRAHGALRRELGQQDKSLARVFDKLDEPLRRSIVGTMRSFAAKEEGMKAASAILHELGRSRRVTTVGFWDIGSGVGFLPQVIHALNDAQEMFTFFDIVAPAPAGIISRPERVARWAAESGQSVDASGIADNIIDEDFASRAEPIRQELGVDHLIGLVPSMVAGIDDGEPYWNHFSIAFGDRPLMLVSTFELREFAAHAGKPFEVAVALVALSSLLVGVAPRLRYHDDNGCLFDYNDSRVSLVRNIRKPMIEPECMDRIPQRYKGAAQAFVDVLSRFVPDEGPSDEPAAEPAPFVFADSGFAPFKERQETQPIEPSWPARESARFFVRLLAHDQFRRQPELALIALAEREGVEMEALSAIDPPRILELTIEEAQEEVAQILERRRRGRA